MGKFLDEALAGYRPSRMGAEIDPPDVSSLTGSSTATGEDASAAAALLADPSYPSPLVLAFQKAWNAAGKTPALVEDGAWGPNTAAALGNYGTVPSAPAPTGSGQEVPRVATPVSAQAIADALATVWPVVIGGVAPAASVLVLLAQSAFETGDWRDMWNWNLGNVKYSPGAGTDYFTMTASEGEAPNVTMVKSHWRSYPTLQSGAKAYLALLRKRFASAWPYVMSGDASGFVQALKDSGYFTGNVDQYKAGVQMWLNKFKGIVPTVQELETAAVYTGAGIAGYTALSVGVFMFAGTLAGIAGWYFSKRS